MIDFDTLVGKAVQDVFARPDITYTAPNGSPVVVRGTFDLMHDVAFMTGNPEASFGHSTAAPVLSIRVNDWPVAPVVDGVFTIDGVHYVIIDVQPDGYGNLNLIGRT